MKKFFQEFKEFAMRGNVMDLAVGVIVGGAFSSITTSLINDIIMPIIGIFVSEASFADLYFYTNGAMITYGNFLQAVLNFIIMAFIVFCMVKAVNRLTRRKKAVFACRKILFFAEEGKGSRLPSPAAGALR